MTDEDDFDFTKPAPSAGSPPPPPATSSPASASAPPAASSAAPVPPAAPAPPPFKPTISKFYDAEVAKRLFDATGAIERVPAGTTLFLDGEKSGKQGLFGKRIVHRVYFIVEGEVNLVRNDKPLDTIRANEIFGEMAVISEIPGSLAGGTRSASAITKTDCALRSLDGEQLQQALTTTPEFALMLMSVMFDRLRFVGARLAARRTSGVGANAAVPVFDLDALASLEERVERATVVRFDAGKVIMREGDAGTSMYIVLSGRVSISIRDKLVEVNDPGCTFGEMALVDQSPRTATAIAVRECELLALNRHSLMTLIRKEPAVGMLILRSVAQRLRHMTAQLS